MNYSRRSFLFAATALANLAPSTLIAQLNKKIGVPDPVDGVLARRKEALAILRRVLPPTSKYINGRVSKWEKTWEEWVDGTGELPPDFQSMVSQPGLPDPLKLEDKGRKTPITTLAQWRSQRQRIRAGLEHWIFGNMPPPPGNVRGKIVSTKKEGEAEIQEILLEFGPNYVGTLRVLLLVPPGPGPFPVLMTNGATVGGWAAAAVSHGYVGCLHAATDPFYGSRDDSDAWTEIYPEYDFCCLARWAWGAMRAMDYLHTLPFVDKRKIAITGHSRNAKHALLAAAFDERFSAVIPSRGNTGEARPWRYGTSMFTDESIEQVTEEFPHWFHPRLRFFVGREDKLPVDQNLLLALVAPRPMLLSHAYTEHQGNVLAFEASYRSAKSVYRFLGRENRLGMYQRPGEHEASPEDVDVYFDFLDSVFGRRATPIPEIWVRDYTFERWKQTTGERIDPLSFPIRATGDFLTGMEQAPASAQWAEKRNRIRKNIQWILGTEPTKIQGPQKLKVDVPRNPPRPDGFPTMLFPRPFAWDGLGAMRLGFAGINGELYVPVGPDRKPLPGRKFPVVIWMHEYSYSTGYSRFSASAIAMLVAAGFAVLAYDQIGFGGRVEQTRHFYERNPKWSLMGKMVSDARDAIHALAKIDNLDFSKIYLFGYSLGAKIALLTAALDDRVTGVVSICGFAPLRLDTPDKGTEGVRHYSHLHGLMPKLGFFEGQENCLPADWDEVLAAVAPRPVHIIAPTLDRYNPVADVERAVEDAGKVYAMLGDRAALELHTPVNFNRFPEEFQEQAILWLRRRAGLDERRAAQKTSEVPFPPPSVYTNPLLK